MTERVAHNTMVKTERGEAMPIEKRNILYTCGDFAGEAVIREDGTAESILISARGSGRGTNQLIVKSRWDVAHDLSDLLDLVQEMITCGVK